MSALFERYEAAGFTVLAFPCNQFGGQEPGTNAEVAEFARTKYGVRFPMFEKIDVKGDGACDLWRWLVTESAGEGEAEEIPWNFAKFLVDGEGNLVRRYGPKTTPEEIEADVAALLAS